MSLWDAATDKEREILGQALRGLRHAAGHLSAVDVSNAEVNLAEVRYRPLTQLTIQAATDLAELVDEPTSENVGEVHEVLSGQFGG